MDSEVPDGEDEQGKIFQHRRRPLLDLYSFQTDSRVQLINESKYSYHLEMMLFLIYRRSECYSDDQALWLGAPGQRDYC